jgi:hypothetical protein
MRTSTKCSLLLAGASPPDENGFFSLGPTPSAWRHSWVHLLRVRSADPALSLPPEVLGKCFRGEDFRQQLRG